MPAGINAEQFVIKLKAYRSPEKQKAYERSFRTGKGEYGEGDVFIGVRMGQVFALAKDFMDMPPGEIEKLLENDIHEVRVGGVSIMDFQARSKKTSEARRRELYDLYLRRHDRINNWDLIDRAAPHVVGGYLFDKPRDILYRLARSKSLWERRTAIVSTLYFIGKGDVADAFRIAERLLKDDQDLIHKATGWALRYAGQKDRRKLSGFLDRYAATMPRTALRYALEHFDKKQRDHYLSKKQKTSTQGKRQTVGEFDPLKLARPAQRALAAAGIRRLQHLTKFSEAEIKQLHGIGPHALDQLRRALHTNGLSFAGKTQRKR
jgi:hypothetical protein